VKVLVDVANNSLKWHLNGQEVVNSDQLSSLSGYDTKYLRFGVFNY